jgi:hypothetical protein
MMGNHQFPAGKRPSRGRPGVSWRGAGVVGKQGPESDVPSEEPEATSDEMREAAEKSLDQPGGERGDLGDSGPGED